MVTQFNIQKRIASVMGSALLVSSTLSAQTPSAPGVTLEKRLQGPLSVISSQKGTLDYRHYTFKESDPQNSKRTKRDTVVNQVRANLTVNTIDDIVSTTLTLAAQVKNDYTNQVTQRQPEIHTDIAAVDSDYFALTPYVNIRTPMDNKSTAANLGFAPALKHPAVDTVLGKFESSLTVRAEGQWSSQKGDAAVSESIADSRREAFGLVTNEKGAVVAPGKKDTSYEVVYNPSVKLDMTGGATSGFSVGVMAEYYNRYETEIREVNGEEARVYVPSRETLTYANVSYKINDQLKFSNDLIFAHNDLWGKPGYSLGNNVENLAKLTWTFY